MLGTIVFVVVNLLPTTHFMEFSTTLRSQGYDVQIYSTGQASIKLHEHQIPTIEFNLEEDNSSYLSLAQRLAQQFQFARAIITEVGNDFMGMIHQELNLIEGSPVHLAYYENPENFVPGGYSKTAASVMKHASGVLFANLRLVNEPVYEEIDQPPIPLPAKKRFGIGYYPWAQVLSLRDKREKSHRIEKLKFLQRLGLLSRSELEEGAHSVSDYRLLVYFGANNEDYFRFAFPKFLDLVVEAQKTDDLSHDIILIQRHPGAIDKGYEPALLKNVPMNHRSPRWIISDLPSENALIAADAAIYYQTTLANRFAFCRIPTLQVAHRVYLDLLLRSQYAQAATNSKELVHFLKQDWCSFEWQRKMEGIDALLFEGLGIDPIHWGENLTHSISFFLHADSQEKS